MEVSVTDGSCDCLRRPGQQAVQSAYRIADYKGLRPLPADARKLEVGDTNWAADRAPRGGNGIGSQLIPRGGEVAQAKALVVSARCRPDLGGPSFN